MLKNPLGWYKRKTKPVWKLALQRVAVVLLVASLGFGSVMVVSPTARAAVIRWVVEWYETHIVYRYSGDGISGGMPRYGIVELPDGYDENDEQRIEFDNYIGLWYENEFGDVILFDYTYMNEATYDAIFLDEGDVLSEVTVNGCWGQLITPNNPDNSALLTWIDEEANLSFSIRACYGEEEILAMAESVAIVKEKKQMPQYEIARIPDGFIESDRIENSSSVSLFYEDDNGGVICFDYVYMHQGAATLITVDGNITDITINGVQGQLFLPTETKNTTTVTWIDADANIQFVIDTSLNQENAIALAESVFSVEKKDLMPQYEISALPTGYQETDYVVLPSNVSAAYENAAGDMICFDYVYMTQGAAWQFETEGSERLDVMVNGCKGQLLVPDDPANWTTLTWIDPKQNLQFCIDAVGNKDSVIRLAESIVLKDTSKGGNN